MGVQYGIMNAMLDSNTVLLRAAQRANSCSSTRTRRRCCSARASTGGGSSRPRACPASRRSTPVYLEYQLGDAAPHRDRPRRAHADAARPRRSASIPTADVLDLPGVTASRLGRSSTCPAPRSTTARAARTRTRRTTPANRCSASSPTASQTELAGRDITLVGAASSWASTSAPTARSIVSDRTFAEWVREPYTAPGVDPLAEVDLGRGAAAARRRRRRGAGASCRRCSRRGRRGWC